MISWIGAGLILPPAVVLDLKKRRIPLLILLIATLPAVPVNLLWSETHWLEMAGGALFGGVFLLLAVVTHEKIGYGDGFLIAALGLWLGIERIAVSTLLGMLAAGLTGVVLMIFKKKRRKDQLPFAPFLAVGCILRLILEFI